MPDLFRPPLPIAQGVPIVVGAKAFTRRGYFLGKQIIRSAPIRGAGRGAGQARAKCPRNLPTPRGPRNPERGGPKGPGRHRNGTSCRRDEDDGVKPADVCGRVKQARLREQGQAGPMRGPEEARVGR